MIQLLEVKILFLKIELGLLGLGIITSIIGVIEVGHHLKKLLKLGLEWLLKDIKSMLIKQQLTTIKKYIKESLSKLEQTQFGYDAFGLKNDIKRDLKDYIIAYKNKFVDSFNI